MTDVAYRSWSLIHRDLEPTQQQPTIAQPPMMTAMALDPHGSLHFVLAKAPEVLLIRLVATGFSVEGRAEEFLRVYRGAPGSYKPVAATWQRSQDGAEAVFTTAVSGAGDCLKLHLPQGRTAILTGISFRTE
ncbi:MAG: hypothetical protein O2782_17905 [bacterium]|nr:hypothetical protein [bacterium]